MRSCAVVIVITLVDMYTVQWAINNSDLILGTIDGGGGPDKSVPKQNMVCSCLRNKSILC